MVGVLCALLLSTSVVGSVAAHDEIATSNPENQAHLDEPISEVTIEFGEQVSDVELAIANPNDVDLVSTTTQLSDTSARLEFDELTQQGRYIVRYIAQEDGHLITGAITFVFGAEGEPGVSALTWAALALLSVAILGIGAFFTLRRRNQPVDDGPVEA